MSTRKVLGFPTTEQLWNSVDLGEQRFLPVISRMKSDRASVLRATDRIGRPSAIAATTAGLACALDSVAPDTGLAPIAVVAGVIALSGFFFAIYVCFQGLQWLSSEETQRPRFFPQLRSAEWSNPSVRQEFVPRPKK